MWKATPDGKSLVPLGEPQGPLGLVPREAAPGHTVWEYAVEAAHMNPNGVLHGGVLMMLLDSAMGHAVAEAVMPGNPGRFNAAAQISVSFVAPVRAGVLRAEATVVKVGKRLAVVEARATDASGTIVATATATHAILP